MSLHAYLIGSWKESTGAGTGDSVEPLGLPCTVDGKAKPCRWFGKQFDSFYKVTCALIIGPSSPTAGYLRRGKETTKPCRQPGS